MITLQEMAEHRFSNVYFYECLTLYSGIQNFGENHTPLQRNGMTAIPKIKAKENGTTSKCVLL